MGTSPPSTRPPPAGEAIGLIPARLASTRFPEKVLASRTGKALIQHVWESAKRARSLSRVVVAADDDRIVKAVHAFGGEAVMTSPSHPNGSSRLAEAARLLGIPNDALIVNVQGDEPELEPAVIDLAVASARESPAEVATVASPFHPGEDPRDPNLVKVCLSLQGFALYFSRSLIPFAREGAQTSLPPLRHVGLYVYRAGFLHQYVDLPPTPLERTEMLEQLRVLEHGHRIVVAVTDVRSQGIDTPEQYEAFVARQARRR